VSDQYISKSITSWFMLLVESILDSRITLTLSNPDNFKKAWNHV